MQHAWYHFNIITKYNKYQRELTEEDDMATSKWIKTIVENYSRNSPGTSRCCVEEDYPYEYIEYDDEGNAEALVGGTDTVTDCSDCFGGGSGDPEDEYGDNGDSSGSGNGGTGDSGSGDSDEPILIPDETIIPVDLSPCAGDIVSKIKDGNFGGDMLVNLLRDIFNKNDFVNITIEERTLNSSTDGEFDSTAGGTAASGFFFNGTLTINDLYTTNGSKDWVLATIIHEMIHGYIDHQRSKVSLGFITQEEFNREFPLFSSSDPNSDHLTMGYQYVNAISSILKQNNPTLSNEEALSLSRVGLHDTTFWNTALSTGDRTNSIHFNNVGRGTITDINTKQIKC